MQGIVKGGLNDGGSAIKSIQPINIEGMNASPTNVTITSVDTTKSILIFSYYPPGNTSTATLAKQMVRGRITSSTNVEFTVNTYDAAYSTMLISAWVIEFNNASVQSGTVTVNSTSTNIPISSVNLSKSFVVIYASTTNTNNTYYSSPIRAKLTSTTNLRIEQDFSNTFSLYYQVVTFT